MLCLVNVWDLGGSEAEGCGRGVWSLSVLQHDASVLRQRQIVTGGQVTQTERLTPADVTATPAVHTQTWESHNQ